MATDENPRTTQFPRAERGSFAERGEPVQEGRRLLAAQVCG